MASKVQLKRVYAQASDNDGVRFFVERLWPRGVSRSSLAGAIRLGDVAPSAELREWFHHDPQRWNEFRRRYFAELKQHEEVLSPIMDAARNGTVTLLYSAHDPEHNNAVALKEFLQRELEPRHPVSCLCL